ncbi:UNCHARACTERIZED [Ceraceosorus bombacis]|uniref:UNCHARACTERIZED n=1 Tax=Ceraceosorus bombacis TaxID=401625 RepID=A0A0N7LB70_9BASI|nr:UNCHARACTERIZED [Ceraceosorus bombacis]
MGGKKLTAKTIRRKNAATHPDSRRAAQLQRVAHRQEKLSSQRSDRKKDVASKLERLRVMITLLPSTMTHLEDLSSLHAHVRTKYLSRHSTDLQAFKSQRRQGRPPDMREVRLQDAVKRDEEEYRTGLIVPDLLDRNNVALLRKWVEEGAKNQHQLGLFRFRKISALYPDQFTLVQAGLHKDLAPTIEAIGEASGSEHVLGDDESSDVEENDQRGDAPQAMSTDA